MTPSFTSHAASRRQHKEVEMRPQEKPAARPAEVRDLMIDRVFTLGPADDLESLYDLMDVHHIRHVPIVDRDGDLVGLVTQRDLARSALGAQDLLPLSVQQEILRRRKVREIMATEVETVEPDESLKAAAEMLLENKIGCLPVVEGEHLVGILTESDFVRLYVERS
jgi:CBS domain-containing membrane protein